MTNLPKVSIIITAFSKKAKPHLDLCIKSIWNLNYPKELYEVIIVSHKEYWPEYYGAKTVGFEHTNYFNSEAMNHGVKHADPESKHYFILNDDVILTKNCLVNLVTCVGDAELITTAITNTDNNVPFYYSLLAGYTKQNQFTPFGKRFYKYEDLTEDDYKQIMNMDSVYAPGVVFKPFLCLYAALIPKKVWDKVGPFDENYKTGQEDVHFCWQARRLGIYSGVALNAFIFHWGGLTSSETITDDLRRANAEYFKKFWGCDPP